MSARSLNGIYLWHWPLLEIAKDIGFDRLLDKLIIGGLGAFLMAAISYHYVERPVLRLKRLFATAADNRDASAHAPDRARLEAASQR